MRKAAVQGYIPAQRSLGDTYRNGFLAREDLDEAMYWYLKAAEQGDAESQNSYGEVYSTTHLPGTALTDESFEWAEEEAKWFRKAAAQGNAKAQDNLGKCTISETGSPMTAAWR